jgi:hypothetical protein
MNAKRVMCLLAIVVVSMAWISPTAAAPPWASVFSFDRVEADSNKEYKLTAENGPWTIMASTFSATEDGRQQARDLVLELRKRYKLPAYIHEMSFDFGDTQVRGVDRYGDPLKARYKRGSEGREVAVLVGDYRAVDDPKAQKVLKKLKYSQPQSLDVKGGKTNQTLAALRHIQRHVLDPKSEKKKMGPMSRAFVTTNPLLPKEYFSPKGVDDFIVKMNKNVSHSLLECPGYYTVRVGTFHGNAVFNQSEIKDIKSGKRSMKSGLDIAAEKAHRLTEALRIKGYEAYEFHDRNSSIVTVGSFESLGSQVGGRLVLNSRIQQTIKVFSPSSQQSFSRSQDGTPTPYRTLANIPFDIQPLPIEVPKRTLSRQIAGGMF